MKLDNEKQRSLLLQLIDNVPIQGTVGQVVTFVAEVQALKAAIAAAPVEHDGAQEMLLSR